MATYCFKKDLKQSHRYVIVEREVNGLCYLLEKNFNELNMIYSGEK